MVLVIAINGHVIEGENTALHDDVIKWEHFPRYCFFGSGIHQAPFDSPHKGSDTELGCFL